uniref:Fibronectin type III domain protein n=1 Tax=Marseillevirus LCMAC102 TaxID=2506603 RepID=A0A481YTH1_9VIRU|nr:MAG: fibronectin type III domain protein [Marseillevirus LCMAC102]
MLVLIYKPEYKKEVMNCQGIMMFALVAVLLFMVYWCFFNTYELFPGSKGYYSITWDPPSNVHGESDVKYHVKIVDSSTGATIIEAKGLSGTLYEFSQGKWDSKYTVEVSAINSVGEGSSTSIDFTSGDGPFDASQIKGIQLWGSTGPLPTSLAKLEIGDEFSSLAVVCDIPKNVARIASGSKTKDVTTHISIEYTSASNGDTCTWKWTKDAQNNDGVDLMGGTTFLATSAYDVQVGAKCSPHGGVSPTSATGTACSCPIQILTNDKMKITYTFIQSEYGTTTVSTTIKYSATLPSQPTNLKSVWKNS